MNMYKWIDQIIESDKKQAFPVLSFPAIQKMGISVAELISTSDNLAQGMKIVAEATPAAAASVSYMDLSVEAEAFGSTIRVSDDEVPTVIGSIIETEEDADTLKIPLTGCKRTGINIEAMGKACKLITDRPIFAGVIGPFSLAGRLMDVSEIMILCYEEPELVDKVLEKVTVFLIDYIKAYKQTGCQGVVMAEPLAGLLSPDIFEPFSSKYVCRIVEAVQDEEFLVVYHNCGNSVVQCIDSVLSTGAKMYHFGNAIDLTNLMDKIPSDRIFMGNVDPASQFKNGTIDCIYQTTTEIMKKCCGKPNFVISSGCDIPPLTPWENIDAFFQAVEDFYK